MDVSAQHAEAEQQLVHVLWLTSGLGCDGDTIAMTSATSPRMEDLLSGSIPGTPSIVLYNPFLSYETGQDFLRHYEDAATGRLDPFLLVVEGSIPNERINGDGYWAAFGTDRVSGQPITTCSWVDRLAPRASAVLAMGTCAAFGGIPAMKNNPTGAMGLRDYLGRDWVSRLGIPLVNLPGCPVQPDSITETILQLVFRVAGLTPDIELDDQGRPAWLFERTVHEGCDRAGLAEQGHFAEGFGDGAACLVKLGCMGPVVKCNVPHRGWIAGVGGCPNVGGICIACASPGFPDKFMPFVEPDRLGELAARTSRFTYAPVLRYFRERKMRTKYEIEPEWRQPSDELATGYSARW